MAFSWRGNRYVVNEVLGHWRERRSWWTSEVPAPRGRREALAEEYEVWRVEAIRTFSGLHTATGVYDLCHASASRPDIGSWRLLRVVD